MSIDQPFPLTNQTAQNTCCCRKPQCRLCSPFFFYPYSNPYFSQYYSGQNMCGINDLCNKCEGKCKCKRACDPYLPERPKHFKQKIVTWRVKYLVSNMYNHAAHYDENLVNPWGIVVANNEIWVTNSSSNLMTSYDLHGNKLYAPVQVRDNGQNSAFPTGLTVNCTGGFSVSNGRISHAAFLVNTMRVGTVHVYSRKINETKSYLVINQDLGGEVVIYKGCVIAGCFLYCADFYNRKIDVFDENYNLQSAFPFVDNDITDPIPLDYGPNNIAHIGCYLYVSYAKQVPDIPFESMMGSGNGYISVFNLDGTFVRRFHSKGVLNDPWAMIPAPCECGLPKDGVIVGNHGDGTINIFNCAGEFCGKMLGPAGIPICIEGLWGLATYYKCNNEIFFCSSPDFENNNEGLLGSIIVDQVLHV